MKRIIILTILFIFLFSSTSFAVDKIIKITYQNKNNEIIEKIIKIPNDSIFYTYGLKYITKEQLFMLTYFEDNQINQLISFSINDDIKKQIANK